MGIWKKLKDLIFGNTDTQELLFKTRQVNGRTIREGWVRVNGDRRPMTEEELNREEDRLNSDLSKLDEELAELDKELEDR